MTRTEGHRQGADSLILAQTSKRRRECWRSARPIRARQLAQRCGEVASARRCPAARRRVREGRGTRSGDQRAASIAEPVGSSGAKASTACGPGDRRGPKRSLARLSTDPGHCLTGQTRAAGLLHQALRNGVSRLSCQTAVQEGRNQLMQIRILWDAESKNVSSRFTCARVHRARYEADVSAVQRKKAQELASDWPLSSRTVAMILTRSVLCPILIALEVNRGF
jgi:hypothetical protein